MWAYEWKEYNVNWDPVKLIKHKNFERMLFSKY